MKQYYLAVDIGASSGRHILGTVEDGILRYEEIYRFSNSLQRVGGELCWNLKALFEEIVNGLKKCKELGKIPVSMGIDTWGVDFVLLDKEDHVLGNTVGYRDARTANMDALVYQYISEDDLYQRTGIQKQIFNTIYQLMAVKKNHPEQLEAAESMLMIPDYFHFLLTGNKVMEYTNATTTQLVNPNTKEWDYELINKLGYPERLFQKLSLPGTLVGGLKKELAEQVGFDLQVILPATHDTGSAVMAVPCQGEESMYISSGTWSLMGMERFTPDCSLKSKLANFTNEGGYDYRFRYLKNIMGLWMIQSLKKELNDKYSFAQLCEMASKESITSIVDCNDDCFLSPESMITAIQDFCKNSKQPIPESAGELAAVIYNSLAVCYGETVREMEKMTGKVFECIHIVGGGANAEYLNELTAKATKKDVLAGPSEATAIGNLLAQMIQKGEFDSLAKARECVRNSFELKHYKA